MTCASSSQSARYKRKHIKATGFAPISVSPCVQEIYNKISLTSIVDITNLEDYTKLAEIGSKFEIYKHLGPRNPWNAKYIADLYKMAAHDAAIGNMDYIHLIVKYETSVVGYVGLRPSIHKKSPGFQIRAFIDPCKQQQGLGTEAIRQAMDFFRTLQYLQGLKLWVYIEDDNTAAIKTATKLGFKYQCGTTFKGVSLLVWYWDVPISA